MSGRLQVLALASYPEEAASSRFRIVQFAEPLASRGIDVNFVPFLDSRTFGALYDRRRIAAHLPRLAARVAGRLADAFRRGDVVYVQREAMLMGPPAVEWIATRARRRRMVLDLDDATWVPYASPVYGRLATLLKRPSKVNRLIDRAHTVTCGNPVIAEYARRRGARTVVIPTVVPLDRYRPNERNPGVPVVGWIGSHGTFAYLERLLPLLESIAAETPFRLLIVGSGRTDVRLRGVEVSMHSWTLDADVEDFRSIDIGLYPIDDDAWGAGKSGLKAVQYMACGVPFVMSPVGVCATMGEPGRTHLAATTTDEWSNAIRRLLADAALRRSMGSAGRAFAEANYSLSTQADTLAAVLREAAQ